MSGDVPNLEHHQARVMPQQINDINPSAMAVPKPPAISNLPKLKLTPTPGVQPAASASMPTPAANPGGSPIEQAKPEKPTGPAPEKVKVHTKKKAFGGMNRDTSEYVIESLSMLLLAGVTVGESIQSIAAEIPQKGARQAMLEMRNNIDEGVPFALALEQTGLFSPSVITLIEVGESTGKLPENLKVVAAQMHKNNVMNAKIKSAMLYPAFLVGLLFVVGTGIGVFLLPKLLDIITGLQVEVGLTTKILIVGGTFFGKFGLILAAITVVVIILLSILIKKSSGARAAAEVVLYRIPGVKKLLFETEISRFGFVLGTLLDAGLPVVTALQSLAASMATRRYAHFATEMCQRVDEGDSFDKILSDKKYHKLLPGTITQIVVSAEKSGNLSSSLLKVGQNYEDKADITAHNLETLLEPIVLVLIAVAVLFVAMAVFLPIYSLIGNLNGA
ncbi:MAG: type II secretion system F family protein [Candidatus Saccharimonadales bacterium]